MKLSEEEQQKYQAFQSSVRSRLARCLFTGSLDDAVEKSSKGSAGESVPGPVIIFHLGRQSWCEHSTDYSLKTRQESQVIVGSLKGNQGDRRQ